MNYIIHNLQFTIILTFIFNLLNDSLVIIPTYNEIENIESIIRKVLSLPKSFDILIVDDGSPDGTGQKVEELQKELEAQRQLLQRQAEGMLKFSKI